MQAQRQQYQSTSFKVKKQPLVHIAVLSLALLLSGCASLGVLSEKLNVKAWMAETPVPNTWQTTLPHGGKQENLVNFWAQYNDPLLLDLITRAQAVSSTVATAKTNIASARASRVSAWSSLLPTLDAKASASKALQQPPISSTGGGTVQGGTVGGFQGNQATVNTQVNAQAAWELDLFGANRGLYQAAQQREKAAEAGWHDARVAVAAELATSYFNERFCQMQLSIAQSEVESRTETMRVTQISAGAGFTAEADLQLAIASSADAAQQRNAQQALCDLGLKELVALTDLPEASLKEKLSATAFNANTQNQPLFAIAEIPATVIAQRPDILSAEADLMSAAAEVKNTKVQRLPKVSLNGSIGWMRLTGSGFEGEGQVWSIGPVSISLPIFDAGKLRANVDSAEAKYSEAAVNYRSKVRNAIKEVESALVNLNSAEIRQPDVEKALQAYQASLVATEHKLKAGFTNVATLEENRRYALQAKTNQVNLLKDRNNAWIALYRAAGGGWKTEQSSASASTKDAVVKD